MSTDAPVLPRDNPFRSGRIGALRFRGPEAGATIDRWEALGRRGALVGPCGSGKTTFLRLLVGELERRGHPVEPWFLRADDPPPGPRTILRELRALDRATVLVIDGAEQLGALAWGTMRLAARSLGGLLVTAHTPGRLPTLHTHDAPLERALDLVSELDPTACDGPDARAHIAALHRRAGGNLRTLFHDLYLERAMGSRTDA